ncbi:ABC transporter substrate-binding protein [Marisediminicola sp. LYQ134]|uniref:ABC transporter substrate-binding protein n=1 Tax=Marisediminicola sp. LYQ134 TaxID=3391061 RepID=UPI003983A461
MRTSRSAGSGSERRGRSGIPIALSVVVAVLAAGCTTSVVDGSEVDVAVTNPFTSYNRETSAGGASSLNAEIVAATNERFVSYDDTPELVDDDSFVTIELESDDPLRVSYTLDDGAEWSDGVPIDATDLLLSWAANSGALDDDDFDDTPYFDEDAAGYTDDFPRDVVFFDGSAAGGLDLVTTVPEVSDDGRAITLEYDHYFVDWRLAFDIGVPAHVVAMNALDIDDPSEAKSAVRDAIVDDDRRALAPLSRFWNSGFAIDRGPVDASLFVGSGPYTVTAVTDGGVELTASETYTGERTPAFERVTISVVADADAAATALLEGEVDVIAPEAGGGGSGDGSGGALERLLAADGVTVTAAPDGSYERLDLMVDRGLSGVFDDPLVRRAFLHTVPRAEIAETALGAVVDDPLPRDSHVFIPGSDAYDDAVGENDSAAYAEPDLAAARALLRRADVDEPEVCVLYDARDSVRVAEFELIRDSAARAGFEVTDCGRGDWQNLLGVPRRYDAAIYALRSTTLATSAVAASFASSGGVNNTNFFANDAVDDDLAELEELGATGEAEDAGVREILTRIDQAVWNAAAGMPLYQRAAVLATSDRVTGAEPMPFSPNGLGGVTGWRPAG